MIDELFQNFGNEAYNILKKYEGKSIRINKINYTRKPLIIDFVDKFQDKATTFFNKNLGKVIRCNNADLALKKYLNNKAAKEFKQIKKTKNEK
ncbi:MAG TPA: hypothetical protein VN698_12555 [Bacteroidia bacterium]|nr:hypothetical protein [Bacteroidia bacterium]